MTRKSFATLGIVVVLLVSLVGTVAAQTGTTPTVTPVPTSDAATTTSPYANPIVQILAAYFGKDAASETLTPETPTETPTDTATADPNATETATPTETPTQGATSQETLAQQIETYHQEGMGFGVLVKLYAMAEASQIVCPTATTPTTGATPVPTDVTTSNGDTTVTTTETQTCTAVTVDQLVQEFKSGTGMGQLFKEYGKPSLLGVGHVKHALLEEQQQQPTLVDGTQPTLEDGTGTMLQPNMKNNKQLKNNKTKVHGNPNKGQGNNK